MKLRGIKLIIAVVLLQLSIGSPTFAATARSFPPGTQEVTISNQNGVRSDLLPIIARIVNASISQGEYPGAVVLAAHQGHIIYKGVFGNRRLVPDIAPMKFNTIFDMASLTKVLATTPAIMQLLEEDKIDLDAPVAVYWPGFAVNGKSTITIRELMTHTSGLAPDLPDTNGKIIGAAETLHQIEKLKPTHPPGTTFVYSDINFYILGHLVEKISGQTLSAYSKQHIFKLLDMHDTEFLPSTTLQDRIAPTEIIRKQLRWGEVDDPGTYAMGGVSGAAGLFSDAADIGNYLDCLTRGGRITASSKTSKQKSTYLLSPLTILKMTTPQTSPTLSDVRGLGWDIDSHYANRGILFPTRSYGHTGWTGTSVWLDPITHTWLIILTSRVHPTPASFNKLIQDRREIANIIAASITDVNVTNQTNTGVGELSRAYKS
jgi:CubicO group peptidase (beta-lactamase class C family)